MKQERDAITITRAVYDATASRYAATVGTTLSPATEGPIDLALLEVFAELVRGSTVADVGCGPGRVAAFLADRGSDVVGVDVSASMVAVAREAHPGIRFEEGLLTKLPFEDGSLGGAVCWYSIIHTPPGHLDDVFSELARVLSPPGHVMIGFHAGSGEAIVRPAAYGTDLTLTNYRHDPMEVALAMQRCGLQVRARTERVAELDHELTPQAFLLARLGPGSTSTAIAKKAPS